MNKELLVNTLMEKDEKILALAVAYAEVEYLCGVDITEEFTTAFEMKQAMDRAYKAGYTRAVRDMHEHNNSQPDLR